MNKTPAEAKALIEEAKPLLEKGRLRRYYVRSPLWIFAPLLRRQRAQISRSALRTAILKNHRALYRRNLGSQCLSEMGGEYVILGHSERRTYFGDTDETVAKRLKAALENGP